MDEDWRIDATALLLVTRRFTASVTMMLIVYCRTVVGEYGMCVELHIECADF